MIVHHVHPRQEVFIRVFTCHQSHIVSGVISEYHNDLKVESRRIPTHDEVVSHIIDWSGRGSRVLMAYRIFQKIIAEDTDAPAYPQGKKVIVYKGRFGYSYQELSQLENELQMLSGYIRQLEELDPDIVKSSDRYSEFTAFCAERKLVRESVVSIQNLLKEIKHPDTKVLKLGPTIFVPMTDDVKYEPVVRLNFGC